MVSKGRDTSIPPYLARKIDPDRMSYEQILEMQEMVGFVSKGLTSEQMELLEVIPYDGDEVQCAICQVDIVHGEMIRILPRCEHIYHTECIDSWLEREKKCPLCLTEIFES